MPGPGEVLWQDADLLRGLFQGSSRIDVQDGDTAFDPVFILFDDLDGLLCLFPGLGGMTEYKERIGDDPQFQAPVPQLRGVYGRSPPSLFESLLPNQKKGERARLFASFPGEVCRGYRYEYRISRRYPIYVPV